MMVVVMIIATMISPVRRAGRGEIGNEDYRKT